MNSKLLPLLCLLLLLGFTGCDGLNDDDGEDFDPDAGKGALFINNDSTSTRVHTYVDGERQPGRAGADSERVYQLDPGDYRVMLVDSVTDKIIYMEDISILGARVFVLDVYDGGVSTRLE